MATTQSVLEQLVDQLTAAGIRATVDQRSLNPPGALVTLGGISFSRLSGFEVEAVVYLVAPNAGTLEALAILDPMVGPAALVAGIDRFDAYPLPSLDGGDPLPALRGTAILPSC